MPPVVKVMGIEQRKHQRINVSSEVRCETEALNFVGQMTNLSVGGCYVKADVPVGLASSIKLKLRLSGEKWLPLSGTIMHYYPNQGFGIRFNFASENEENFVARLIDVLSKGER